MTSGLTKTDGFGGSQKHGKDHEDSARAAIVLPEPEDTQGCESRQGVEEVWKDILGAFRKTWQAHTLISDAWPPEQ